MVHKRSLEIFVSALHAVQVAGNKFPFKNLLTSTLKYTYTLKKSKKKNKVLKSCNKVLKSCT